MSTQTVPGSPAPADRKRSKKKLIGAAVTLGAGIAILLSSLPGTSLAGWEAGIDQPGATIQSGALGIATAGAPGYFDTSPDKTAPTTIDLATFRTVPGDQISIGQAQAITMVGTNLKADWIVEIPAGGALTGALATPGAGVSGKVYVGKGTFDPATFTPASALASAPLDGTGPTAVVHFNQPALNGGAADLNDGTLTDGTAKLFTVVVIDYDASATDTTVQATQADLSAIRYTLKQVR